MSSELLFQTLQHLSQAAKLVDGENRTNRLLSSYYLSRIQRIAATEHVVVERPAHSSCDKCSTSFSDGKNFSLSIKPRKIRKAKYKRLVTESENRRPPHDNSHQKSKKKLGRKYNRLVFNVAKINCKLCNSNSTSSIRFDSKDKSKQKSRDPPIIELAALELVNPKKRKRDKNAGLIFKPNTPSSTVYLVPSKPVIQPIKIVPTNTKTNKAKNSKNSTADKKTKNVSSAQKQRKGMLLLANVLKMNDQKQKNSSQSQLSKMFK